MRIIRLLKTIIFRVAVCDCLAVPVIYILLIYFLRRMFL